MKVGGVSTAGVPEARQVEPRRTPVTRGELRSAIGRALEKVDGRRPSAQLVDVLTAHASLETASGDRMYNFNFGGIKGKSPSGATAACRTHEVLGGKDVVIRDGFRAYGSLDEGAVDYVRTMKGRFGSALEPASRGDTAGFAHALKKAGYYTASESDYASALARLVGAPSTHATPAASVAAAEKTNAVMPLTSEGLSRAFDLLDAGRFAEMSVGSSHAHRAEREEEEDS